MKVKKIVLFLAIMIFPVVFALAEGPGGPGSGNGTGTPEGNGGIPVGHEAPIGSGIGLMMLYAGAYCVKRIYSIRKKKD